MSITTFFVRLDGMGPHMPAGITQTVIFSILLAASPRSVARIDELNDETIPAPPAARITAATSMAAFSANPHGTYFHDPAARRQGRRSYPPPPMRLRAELTIVRRHSPLLQARSPA